MPRVTDNSNGTKTLTIESDELRALRNRIAERVPEFKRALQLIDSPTVRATLSFLKSGLA